MDTTNIVARSAIRLAEEVKACAIVVSGDFQFDVVTTIIPIYFASVKPKSVIEHLVSSGIDKERQAKDISDQITREVAAKIEYIENVAAIEKMLGQLTSGIVVGIVGTKDSSAIVVHDIDDNPLIKTMQECEERVSPDVMRAVLTIAFSVAATGREGKQVGTAFIVADEDEVMKRSHQMILNPYTGHEDKDSTVLNKQNWESIKEFAQLDGVFVVSEDGIIKAAGRYLDVDAKDIDIDKGLGGRHVSAAAITRDTVAIAVTVSESGGVVRIFMDGKESMCIENAERAVRRQ
ncbi:MAG: diadenylate cyclase [Methanosarcinaceae archaeon]|nr:diadenylate cyclase [Methanosarcinaceae archaeon]MDF1534202.1 diadenylate cyclase [Methanosarcinaceae archaeon]